MASLTISSNKTSKNGTLKLAVVKIPQKFAWNKNKEFRIVYTWKSFICNEPELFCALPTQLPPFKKKKYKCINYHLNPN